MEDIKLIIASNIASLRNSANLTQADLATKLNYSDKAVSKWERGESVPDISVLKQISDIFGVTVDYLITSHFENEIDACEYHKRQQALIKNKRTIIAITVLSIFAVALLIFVIFWLVYKPIPFVFAPAVPVALVTTLILHSCFEGGKYNYLIVSTLIASIFLLLYLIFLIYIKSNWWQICILILPAEIINYLAFHIKKH